MTRVVETREGERKESHSIITRFLRRRETPKQQEMPPKSAYAPYQVNVNVSPTVQSVGQVHSVKAHQSKNKSELTSNGRGKRVFENDEAEIRNLEQELPLIECGTRITEPPSEAEKLQKRSEFGFSTDTTHIAVVGAVGTETRKFVDLFSQCPSKGTEKIVWHAIPEAGSQEASFTDYFHNQGLYAYNAIIILMKDRLTDIDCSIASMSHRCRIPFICIRLKSDYLIDWQEVPINERAQMMGDMRANILANLRGTLVKDMKIPDKNFPFFLINTKALKRRIQNKISNDVIECDEVALLDYLQKRFDLCIPSAPQNSATMYAGRGNHHQSDKEHLTPKVELTPPPKVGLNQQQSFIQPPHSKVASPTVAFMGSSGLPEALSEAKGEAGDKWSSLKNVHWYQLPPMKVEHQTFTHYLDSLFRTSYQAVIILVGPWINYPEICVAGYCENREIPYVFLRVDDKCCPSCQGCATGLNPPLQHPLGFDRADEWTSSFVPKAFPELRTPGRVFWVKRFALIDEFRGLGSGGSQAAQLLTHIRDLVENKSAPSANLPTSETGRPHMPSGPWTNLRTLTMHNNLPLK